MKINTNRLRIPFPISLNPLAQRAEALARQWAIDFGLLNSPKVINRFQAANFSHLHGRSYPTGSLEGLRLGNEWGIWLFMHDDHCDEAQVGKDPVKLANYHNSILEVLHQQTPLSPDEHGALVQCLADIVRRGGKIGGDDWTYRFLFFVKDYFEGCQWEAKNRATNTVPSIEEYILGRDKSSAVQSCIECGDLTADTLALPAEIRYHKDVKQLRLLTNRVVSWVNDIYSMDKEYKRGDIHNLVILFHHQYDISLQEAVIVAADLINQAVEDFILLEANLPSFGAEYDAILKRQCNEILKSWMRGNLEWSKETLRYHPNYTVPRGEKVDYIEDIL
ncbi:MAG: terpene synthase family protein [Gammaproteobacteria bacterium]